MREVGESDDVHFGRDVHAGVQQAFRCRLEKIIVANDERIGAFILPRMHQQMNALLRVGRGGERHDLHPVWLGGHAVGAERIRYRIPRIHVAGAQEGDAPAAAAGKIPERFVQERSDVLRHHGKPARGNGIGYGHAGKARLVDQRSARDGSRIEREDEPGQALVLHQFDQPLMAGQVRDIGESVKHFDAAADVPLVDVACFFVDRLPILRPRSRWRVWHENGVVAQMRRIIRHEGAMLVASDEESFLDQAGECPLNCDGADVERLLDLRSRLDARTGGIEPLDDPRTDPGGDFILLRSIPHRGSFHWDGESK